MSAPPPPPPRRPTYPNPVDRPTHSELWHVAVMGAGMALFVVFCLTILAIVRFA